MRKCLMCSISIEDKHRRNKYCSKSCSASHTQLGKPSNNRKLAPKSAKPPTCVCCGARISTFDPRRSRCVSCAKEHKADSRLKRASLLKKKKESAKAKRLLAKKQKLNTTPKKRADRYTKPARRAYQLAYYSKRKSILVKLLGSKCVDCGSRKNLEFDHRRQDTKIDAVSTMILSRSFQATKLEALKCDLRCRTCHAARTKRLGHVMYRRKKESSGRRRTFHKLLDKDVRKIKALLRAGRTQQDIASIFGVSRGTISAIATGRTWSDI